MPPEVTIVIPIFNKEEYLKQCLDSVVNQSMEWLELICVDDGSTDRSGTILSDFSRRDARIRIISNERNLGAATSRNRGIKAARGRYLRFVDADDLLPPGSTEILHSLAIETGSDVVRGGVVLFQDDDVTHVISTISVPDRPKTSLRTEPALWIPYWHTSYLISADLIRANDLAYPPLHRGEDPVFIASVLVGARQVSLTPEIVYLYRKYQKTSGSASTSFADVNDTLCHATLVKNLFYNYFQKCWDQGYGPYLLEDFARFIGRCFLNPLEKKYVISEGRKLWGADVALLEASLQ